ncbi:hypothetical protein BJX61DRAFT_522272 [Aspergillus egyptiacus]|nr:hypothetical protein BJX61DRAFT_522272 [Aspergillus egyptiacus]
MNEEAMVKTSEIKALQRAMDESASNASRELQTKDKRIQHLERKMQHLREERAAKAREFSEAQQHISRLMGVMGFKPTSDGLAQNKQRSRPSLEPSQSATTRAQTDSGDGIFQSQDLLATSVDSTTSPHGGRSPKRSRNSAFPSAQPSPSGSHESSSRKSRGPVHRRNSKQYKERKPLGEADQNSRSNSQGSELSPHHSQKSSPASQSNIQNQHHLDGIDLDLDLEFSKDFVFTSTSMSEMNGHAGA